VPGRRLLDLSHVSWRTCVADLLADHNRLGSGGLVQPGVLLKYPTLELDPGRVPPVPPFRIGLAPWAVTPAAELHRQFGDDVELTVGALPYPPGAQPRPRPATTSLPGPLDSRENTVELDGPAVVRSGHTLRHRLLVRNLSGCELQIATNGQVTAAVVDPQTGEVVGGFSGSLTWPLVIFRVAAGATEPIPLLIGTASYTPRLGYAVPAGNGESRQRSRSARTPATHPAGAHRSCPWQSPPAPATSTIS
jgi:hypothetical protein